MPGSLIAEDPKTDNSNHTVFRADPVLHILHSATSVRLNSRAEWLAPMTAASLSGGQPRNNQDFCRLQRG